MPALHHHDVLRVMPAQDLAQLMTHAGHNVLVVSSFVQVIVASKFDNRLKEFAERWEVDKYLSASGYLAPNVRPFFVALPKVSIQIYSH
jgi:hypothetical protein